MSSINLTTLEDGDGKEEMMHEEVSAGTPRDEQAQVKDEIKEDEEEYEENDGSAEEPPEEYDGEEYKETVLPNGWRVPNFIFVHGVKERWNPEWDPLPPRCEDGPNTRYFNDGDEFNEWFWKMKHEELALQGKIVDWHGPYCKLCTTMKPIQKRAAEAANYEKSKSDDPPTEVDTSETTNTNGVPEIDEDLKQETESFQRLEVNESDRFLKTPQ